MPRSTGTRKTASSLWNRNILKRFLPKQVREMNTIGSIEHGHANRMKLSLDDQTHRTINLDVKLMLQTIQNCPINNPSAVSKHKK